MKCFKKTKDYVYIPKTNSKINIIQISDLHYSDLTTEQELLKILKKINKLNPDYITITGDIIDSVENIKDNNRKIILINFLSVLSSIAPTIISLGNHDYYQLEKNNSIYNYTTSFWEQVKNLPNIYLLNNQTYKNHQIEFFGYTQPYNYFYGKKEEDQLIIEDLQKFENYLQESSIPKVGLIHSPSSLTHPKIVKQLQNFDIILSGHMHNGCIPPILDEIWQSNIGLINAQKKLFAHNCRGKIIQNYNNKTTNIIISGALNTFAKSAPIFLQPFNKFFPYYINQIIITNDKEEAKTKRIYKYYK